MSNFKVGDKVKIVNHKSDNYDIVGRVVDCEFGIIVEFPSQSGGNAVTRTTRRIPYWPEELEKIDV